MLDKGQTLREKFHYLEEQLSNPEVVSQLEKYKKFNREYKELKDILEVFDEYEQLIQNIREAKKLLSDPDPEMSEMAREELDLWIPEQNALEEKLKFMLIPTDPEDDKDVIFEIRSGTGGDEASIFVGDLYRMYTKYFEDMGYRYEVIYENEGPAGGFNKLVMEVSGEKVYGNLKFESGAHRVQRVPKTESQGRVHTSAATVVVLPKFEETDINIRKDDLRVDTFRASGAGGQHVNKTESGVRFTHLPTGIVAESTDSRSQHKNREIAMQRLYMKIKQDKEEKEMASRKATRKSLVGTGDRSDKIRTYNYPQNRVTDHRINLTLYSLNRIVDGDLKEIIETLQMAENMEKLKEIEAIA